MVGDNSLTEWVEENSQNVSRRQALATVGLLGAAGLSATTVTAQSHGGNGNSTSADIGVLENPKFVTNAQGTDVPEGDELVFDTAPVSIPLNRFIDQDDEYDNTLFESLNDSRQLVVKPPEEYSRCEDDSYSASWPPLKWNDVADTGGKATVGKVTKSSGESGDAGTEVTIELKDAIPNGQYTVWVVKYAALKNPDKYSDSPFVSPAGNGLVGFHNLGQKFGEPGDAENQFTTDENGDGNIEVVNEGGTLSGVPGLRPLGEDPVEEGPVPFVGTEEDYRQGGARLNKIQNNLRAEDQIAFVGAYHYDDQTWGTYPGPWHLNQFAVSFVFN